VGLLCQQKIKLPCKSVTFGSKPTNVISSDLIHNHQEEENLERQALSNGVKRKALDNLTHKPAKLLRQELRQNEANNSISWLDFVMLFVIIRSNSN
jgi:hypothetical protein